MCAYCSYRCCGIGDSNVEPFSPEELWIAFGTGSNFQYTVHPRLSEPRLSESSHILKQKQDYNIIHKHFIL